MKAEGGGMRAEEFTAAPSGPPLRGHGQIAERADVEWVITPDGLEGGQVRWLATPWPPEVRACAVPDVGRVFFVALGAVVVALALGVWVVKPRKRNGLKREKLSFSTFGE